MTPYMFGTSSAKISNEKKVNWRYFGNKIPLLTTQNKASNNRPQGIGEHFNQQCWENVLKSYYNNNSPYILPDDILLLNGFLFTSD